MTPMQGCCCNTLLMYVHSQAVISTKVLYVTYLRYGILNFDSRSGIIGQVKVHQNPKVKHKNIMACRETNIVLYYCIYKHNQQSQHKGNTKADCWQVLRVYNNGKCHYSNSFLGKLYSHLWNSSRTSRRSHVIVVTTSYQAIQLAEETGAIQPL